jgi:hypothetical protein
MADENFQDILLSDPLGDATRKERRSLLIISIIGITITKTGLVPSKISAIGIEFAETDKQTLLAILAIVTFYFLIAFLVYAISDFLAWRRALRHLYYKEKETAATRSAHQDFLADSGLMEVGRSTTPTADDYINKKLEQWRHEERSGIIFILSGPVSIIRAVLEFVVPPVLGIYAIISLI